MCEIKRESKNRKGRGRKKRGRGKIKIKREDQDLRKVVFNTGKIKKSKNLSTLIVFTLMIMKRAGGEK